MSLNLVTKGLGGHQMGITVATKGYLGYGELTLPGELPIQPPEAWRHPVLPTLHLTGHEPWLSHMPGPGDIPDGIVLPTRFSPQTLPSLRVSGNESWISNLKAAITKASNRSNN